MRSTLILWGSTPNAVDPAAGGKATALTKGRSPPSNALSKPRSWVKITALTRGLSRDVIHLCVQSNTAQRANFSIAGCSFEEPNSRGSMELFVTQQLKNARSLFRLV